MAFATADDVSDRLGRALTDAEETTATGIIATVTGLICDEVDRDADWAAALDPVPEALKGLCVEKARIALQNPTGAASRSETLGAHTVSETAPRSQDVGVFLSDQEGRIARQAVYGKTAGSGSVRSTIDRHIDLAENRDVDEPIVEED